MSIEANKNDEEYVCERIWKRLQKELGKPVGLPQHRELVNQLVPEAIQAAFRLGRISGIGDGHITGLKLIDALSEKISAAISEAIKGFPSPAEAAGEKV